LLDVILFLQGCVQLQKPNHKILKINDQKGLEFYLTVTVIFQSNFVILQNSKYTRITKLVLKIVRIHTRHVLYKIAMQTGSAGFTES
jgi:hypothetical protein